MMIERITSITWKVTVKNYLKELPHTSVLCERPCSTAKDEPRFRVPEGHVRLSKPVTVRKIAESTAGCGFIYWTYIGINFL